MPPGQDPMVQRRRLRDLLRRMREAAGFTQRDVAHAMDWSLSKLIRIETGSVGVSTTDLKALIHHYGINDPLKVDELVQLARAARERAWWSAYRNVAGPETLTFLGYESSAAIIRSFEPLLVPGLLQTEEYAREVVSVLAPGHAVDGLVDLRMERQELMFARTQDPPALNFIVDEAVVQRGVGGPDVMRRQLRHLKEIAQRDNVTLRIVPFSAGMYPRLRVAYVLFEFPAPEDEDVLYLEDYRGEMIIREAPQEETPLSFLETFWYLEQIAPADHTQEILDRALAQLAGSVTALHRGDLEPDSAPAGGPEADDDPQRLRL